MLCLAFTIPQACLSTVRERPLSSLFPAKSLRPVEPLTPLYAALSRVEQGFTLVDEELRLLAWNEAFVRLLDLPAALVQQGRSLEAVIRFNAARHHDGSEDVEPLIQERLRVARRGEPHAFEHVAPSGAVLRVTGVSVPGHGFLTVYTDVTEQRSAEQLIRDQNARLETRVAERTFELRRSEAQMRLITDSIPALVAYFDQHRNYRFINRGYQDWFGLDPSRPEQVSAREFLGLETYTQIKPNVAQALQGRPVTFEYLIHTLDGRTLMARTTLIPELNADGQVIGCFELTFDITEERRAQELLIQAQKMEALGQLTGGLAHDFNNILMVVLGNLTALAEQAPAHAHVGEYIQPAIDAARRGTKLIRGLLTFSRKQAIEARVVDLNLLVDGVQDLVRHTLPSTQQLLTDVHPAPIMVLVDPQQLQNSLLNLILNAHDATAGQGRIEVRSSCRPLDAPEASRLGLAPGVYACLQVSDNGCGMDAATRGRVFEPFFTTKPAGQGTGLGLSMVYGFVRQSGGSIELHSQLGQGTSISLWLPQAPSDAVAEAAEVAPSLPSPVGAGLALLVDDDEQVRVTVRRLLLDLGYAVLEAENGAEAREILDQTPGIRLLLSDIVMPGSMDGRQLARYARSTGEVAHVLLMSGYAAETGSPMEAPLLTKPFGKAELSAALREIGA